MLVTKCLHMKVPFNRFSRFWHMVWKKKNVEHSKSLISKDVPTRNCYVTTSSKSKISQSSKFFEILSFERNMIFDSIPSFHNFIFLENTVINFKICAVSREAINLIWGKKSDLDIAFQIISYNFWPFKNWFWWLFISSFFLSKYGRQSLEKSWKT